MTITNLPKRHRNTRYFVIKSFTQKHLEISIQQSVWATQAHNEVKLNEAFENSDVVLVFSVNNSRHFQGYARMASQIGYQTSDLWTDVGGQSWGGVFKVEWIALFDLPFSDTSHIRNPLNGNKPVKISRDGQELAEETALELCKMIDDGSAKSQRKSALWELLEKSQQSIKQQSIKQQSIKQHSSEGTVKEVKDNPRIMDNNENSKYEDSPRRSSIRARSRSPSYHRTRGLKESYNTSRHKSRRSNSRSPDRSKRNRSNSPNYDRSRKYSRRSPTPRDNFLNMTYEEYLSALNRSNIPFPWPQFSSMPPMSEVDYMNYVAWMSKQGGDMYSRRKK